MKQKSTDQTKKASNLPLKMLFFSYFNNHESIQLMSDCQNAINDKISKLSSMIEDNFEEISSIVQDDDQNQHKRKVKQAHRMMQVIEEEDWGTERSQDEREGLTERNRNLLVKKFNSMIGTLEKSSQKFGEIMFMYKNEIKQIAKDLTKERQLNVKLMKEVQQKGTKDNRQARSSSVNQGKGKKPLTLASKIPLAKRTTNAIKPSLISKVQQQSEDEQARQPPKPFCEQCLSRQKEQAQKQKLQSQEKNKWRQLSAKITNLKNQLSRYEQQLIENQAEISRLNEQVRKKGEDDAKLESEEKRKIKTINTTLRGEKIVLENQVQSLRKKVQDSSEYIASLETDNKKLQMEKDNLQSTIKWHSNTIEDLRNNFSSGIKQEGELLNKYNETREANLVLVEQIANQEKYLEQFAQKLSTVEESFNREVDALNRKINDLQQIIEQKNQTIIRLKLGKHQSTQTKPHSDPPAGKQLTHGRDNRCTTKQSIASKRETQISGTIMSKMGSMLNKTMKREPLATGGCGNENFEENMVKVLNKKLAIKECEVEKLRYENEVLRAELDVYKEIE